MIGAASVIVVDQWFSRSESPRVGAALLSNRETDLPSGKHTLSRCLPGVHMGIEGMAVAS